MIDNQQNTDHDWDAFIAEYEQWVKETTYKDTTFDQTWFKLVKDYDKWKEQA